MTRFGIAAAWAAIISLPAFAAEQQDKCDPDDQSHYNQRICQVERLSRLDETLNKTYQRALASMPQKETDTRKQPEQLRKSQRAWLVYSREQCALEGGLEGGIDSWVASFAGDCLEREVTARIKFLQSIADSN